MFSITQQILQKTEAYLLKMPVKERWYSGIQRHLSFPIKYLFLGLGELFKPISKWAFMAFVFLVIGLFVFNKLEIAPELAFLFLNVCIFLPMVLVLCAVPSTYSSYGISANNIEEISKFIRESGCDSVKKIELLEKSLEKINERIISRVFFYKRALAASWAIYLITFNLEIKLLPKTDNINFLAILTENVTEFWFSMLIVVMVLILIIGYKRASEILIKSIEFSCIQMKFQIINKPPRFSLSMRLNYA